MRVTVIISVYNRPDYLRLVLWGYAKQSSGDFEVVLADDGSGSEIRDVAEEMRRETGLDIVHVWHEDQGFRKSIILNRAIVAAGGDYLIFTDGDCIPRDDLVEAHRRVARPGRYVAGGYLKMPAEVSTGVGVADVTSGRVTELAWLRSRGWRPGRRALRLLRSRRLAGLFDQLTPTAAHFHGNNASVWRDALMEVNGFEGEMGYGGLDRALGYRLVNAGIRGIQARHRAVAIHLHHTRPYKRPEVVERNRERLDSIVRNGEVRARQGIAELAPDPALRVEGVPFGRASEPR